MNLKNLFKKIFNPSSPQLKISIPEDEQLKKAYQDLEQEKEHLSAERDTLAIILTGITDSIIAVDLSKKILIFNKAAEDLTGFTYQDVFGQTIDTVIKVVDPKLGEIPIATYCPITTQAVEGANFKKNDLRLFSRSGKKANINLLSSQIKEGTNINLGCILTIHNTTKEDELEEMKLDFISMAAHELRTPLTTIKGYLSVLLGENIQNLTPDQKDFLNKINISSKQLLSLVENLLGVARIERGALSLNLEPIDWVEKLKQIVTDFQNQAGERNIILEFTPPIQQIPQIEVDKLRIDEILTNLLINAINYTPPGGKINVWIETNGQEVITHIKDTGEGIDKESLPHLFTKFFRASGKISQSSKGTGLGLYIAKSIIQMHQGKIWVDSTFGQGSTFSFSLPIQKPEFSKPISLESFTTKLTT